MNIKKNYDNIVNNYPKLRRNIMEDIKENKNREKWVDDLKAYTCILVVIGHLLQGLNTAEISWNTICYFLFSIHFSENDI